jgi:hypothetical protein
MIMYVEVLLRGECYPHQDFSGIGKTYWQILVGRAISGIGASGMVALTSIVITGTISLSSVGASDQR